MLLVEIKSHIPNHSKCYLSYSDVKRPKHYPKKDRETAQIRRYKEFKIPVIQCNSMSDIRYTMDIIEAFYNCH